MIITMIAGAVAGFAVIFFLLTETICFLEKAFQTNYPTIGVNKLVWVSECYFIHIHPLGCRIKFNCRIKFYITLHNIYTVFVPPPSSQGSATAGAAAEKT